MTARYLGIVLGHKAPEESLLVSMTKEEVAYSQGRRREGSSQNTNIGFSCQD